MFQGVDWLQLLSWRPGDGEPPDLTGYSGEMKITSPAGEVVQTLSTDTGEIELGLFTLAATATEPEKDYNIKLMLGRASVSAIPYGAYKGVLLIEDSLGVQIPPAVFGIKVNQLP